MQKIDMSLRQTIEEIVEKHLPDDSHFVVEIQIIDKGVKPQVKIIIDADEGLKIDTCAKLSRQVGEEIESKELLPEAYVLEVSSPGIDYPLSSKRQYQKNIGRQLEVITNDNLKFEGELIDVGQSDIVLLAKIKEKGKKAIEEKISLSLENIKKSIVLVSFK
jgi:ribosome maturation factor RimP